MEAFELYLDETGNTGQNFLDLTQPVYVLGGWCVPISQLERCREVVADIVRKSDASELKGATMLRHWRGRVRIRDVVQAFLEAGCTPIYNINEKKYVVAAKIVDTFVDPDFNDRVAVVASMVPEAARRLPEILYSLPEHSLDAMWIALREKDSEAIRSALTNLVSRLSLLGHGQLATILEGSRKHIEQVTEALLQAEREAHSKHLNGLEVTSLWTILQELDDQAYAAGLRNLGAIHDRTDSFAAMLEAWFEILKNDGEIVQLEFSGGLRMRRGMRAFTSFRSENSKDELLVQAADVLVALTRVGCEQPERLAKSQELGELWSHLQSRMAQPRGDQMGFVAAVSFMRRALPVLAATVASP